MEFANRSGHAAAPGVTQAQPGRPGKKPRGKLLGIVSIFLLIASALLVSALIFSIATSGRKAESSFIEKDSFQAVFLNGGQVYFGKIRELNKQYLTLDNIYYLRVNEQSQGEGQEAQSNQDVSLAKLGCELHGPKDKMIINRDQVSFWENLKSDGQVAKAVAEFVKQNPEGQKCTDPAGAQQ